MEATAREYWVDGYNLIHRRRWAEDAGLAGGRRRLVAALANLTVAVRVFFDASSGSVGPGAASEDRGAVKVTFVRTGSADDGLITALRQRGGAGVTIVTDDRELRQRAQQLGALTVGVNRFLERLDKSPTTGRDGPRPKPGAGTGAGDDGRPRSVSKKDVEAWIREFGLDDPEVLADLEDGDHGPPPGPTRRA